MTRVLSVARCSRRDGSVRQQDDTRPANDVRVRLLRAQQERCQHAPRLEGSQHCLDLVCNGDRRLLLAQQERRQHAPCLKGSRNRLDLVTNRAQPFWASVNSPAMGALDLQFEGERRLRRWSRQLYHGVPRLLYNAQQARKHDGSEHHDPHANGRASAAVQARTEA